MTSNSKLMTQKKLVPQNNKRKMQKEFISKISGQ